MSVSVVLVAVLLSAASLQQSSAPGGAEPSVGTASNTTGTASSTDELPVSLKRIQRALAKPPSIRIQQLQTPDGRPLYRVDVEAEKIDITTLLGKDQLRGAASYGGMTHQEFLNLVTPEGVRGYAPFSNTEGMIVAATSIALQWAVLKAFDKFKEARDERAREQARKEVLDAVDALRKARAAAGLPDK
jgi:hypothetical protein